MDEKKLNEKALSEKKLKGSRKIRWQRLNERKPDNEGESCNL